MAAFVSNIEPMGRYSLVGSMPVKKRPYWECEAEEEANKISKYFSSSLFFDWKRVVKNSKTEGIKKANVRMAELKADFKIGDFMVDITDEAYLENYITVKARRCIRDLSKFSANSNSISLYAAIEIALVHFKHHEFDSSKLEKYLEITKKVHADYMRLHEMMIFWNGVIDGDEHEVLVSDIEEDIANNEEKILNLIPVCTGLIKRCQDEDWWRRKMRRAQAQQIEKISRKLHEVVLTRSAYCSPLGKKEWKRRQEANLDMLENTVMENDEGEQYTLADLAELSTSNPVVRRTELMVRVAGFESYAKELGYVGHFYTITTPSKYHAAYKAGNRNHKFDGSSPRDGQKYLCALWARFRALAARTTSTKPEVWDFFGFRVAEPHHDGTPHWHLLLFVKPEHEKELTAALRRFSLEEDGFESGAQEIRFKSEEIKTGINPDTGKEYSAAGYIAKYISKNIDGEHVDKDNYGNDAKASARDITSWASRNGIRQFQQIGGPSVTLWRELRRLARLGEDDWEEKDLPLKDFVMQLEQIAEESAADAWKSFCSFYSDNELSLKKTLRMINETIEYLDSNTGETVTAEIEKPLLNSYGETGEKIVGIKMSFGDDVIEKISRFRTWTQVDATPEEAKAIRAERQAQKAAVAAALEVEKALAVDALALDFCAQGAPWTGVNNCTEAVGDIRQTPEVAKKQISLI